MTTEAVRIIVDADACPKTVKSIITTLAKKYDLEVIMIASFNHRLEGGFRVMVVGNEPQSVDLAVINLTRKRDIVVTQDWGLAAVILGKGAQAISPLGMVYKNEKIEFLLEQRHLKAKIRRSGGRTKGPAARTGDDDESFRSAFEELLHRQTINRQ